MPAIASLEDLKAAQKDLQEAKDLTELKAVFKNWRRIGWKNLCGAPMGKGRAIQRLGGGDIPAPSEWSSLPGQALAGREKSGTVERRRESVNSVDLTSNLLTLLDTFGLPIGISLTLMLFACMNR